MSYCRFGSDDSDVYCFYNCANKYEIWYDDDDHQVKTAREAIAVLETLRDGGANVPQYAIDRLAEEDDTVRCPDCHFGELEQTETRRHLHCAVCGHYQEIPEDSEYD